jgi:hypothetical protein
VTSCTPPATGHIDEGPSAKTGLHRVRVALYGREARAARLLRACARALFLRFLRFSDRTHRRTQPAEPEFSVRQRLISPAV